MRNIIFAFVCIALSISFAAGQENKNTSAKNLTEVKRVEMKKLERLVGQWSGTGWILHENGRETFVGTEIVQRKVDGLALLVEGNFKNKEGVVIHETLAVLSPNMETKNFNFRTYLANGVSGEHQFKSIENYWQWGFQTPNGTIRYDIKTDNDIWFEIGEISMDGGKTWKKFFEMSLKKIK